MAAVAAAAATRSRRHRQHRAPISFRPREQLHTPVAQSEVIMTQSESLRMQSEAISAPVPPVGPPRRRVVSQGGAVNGRGRGLHAGTTHPTRPGSHRARAQATLRPPARSRRSRVIRTQLVHARDARVISSTQAVRKQYASRTQSGRSHDAIMKQSEINQKAIVAHSGLNQDAFSILAGTRRSRTC